MLPKNHITLFLLVARTSKILAHANWVIITFQSIIHSINMQFQKNNSGPKVKRESKDSVSEIFLFVRLAHSSVPKTLWKPTNAIENTAPLCNPPMNSAQNQMDRSTPASSTVPIGN
ncbi:predicted protein [Uncinocarpus reesii 1704]|uniref:Uncharacterized protein n=1 Tax=Uncinocarpus reesii (strain UAMH 1704) TaxID=336963 RepID=C4JRL0_UNCRE|nr:uncharacterized protein UREG_05099 [Uncinocarpus reesii 1704]EEP80257.1 predicted protein [Uncinocarpus reesii 1704]